VLAEAWRFTGHDVLLHTLPLFHIHGLFAAINTVLASASGILLLPKFELPSALKHMSEVTVFMGVPTHYTRLLQDRRLNREATAHMRLFVSGSAPLLVDTHREFLRRTGHVILERYGMTETLINTSNPYDGPRVAGSVGPALPGVAARVTNRDSGAVEHQADVIGTLEIAGPNVFAGYWRDPEKTSAEFTADGWFKTGDLARIDRSGYLHIAGRVKDLVISGGCNVYPREVESELDALPGVAESAVFGAPHPDFGEGVTAVIVPRPERCCRKRRSSSPSTSAWLATRSQTRTAGRGAAQKYDGQGAEECLACNLRMPLSCFRGGTMCDNDTLGDMIEYRLRSAGLSRRQFGALSLGAGVLSLLPPVAGARPR